MAHRIGEAAQWPVVSGAVAPRHGLRFLGGTLATIGLLVAGLGVTSWFAAGQAAVDVLGDNTIFTDVSSSIKLATIELCSNNLCVSTWTFELEGSTFAKLALVTLVVGIGFGALVAWAAHRRIAGDDLARWQRVLAYVLGAGVVALGVACMFAVPPDVLSYDISTGRGRNGMLAGSHTFGISTQPTLGIGGWLTLAGVVLGGVMLRPPRGEPAEDAPEEPKPVVKRIELGPPPRGVETDPFRAPPAPPPIAVVKHDRPDTAPVVHDPNGEVPKILR
jgi:hypothetical protein